MQASKTQLTWVDRDGSRLSTVGEPGYFSSPYLSPDGKYLVAAVTDHEQQTQKLWLFDFHRGTANPFTLARGMTRARRLVPRWTASGVLLHAREWPGGMFFSNQ